MPGGFAGRQLVLLPRQVRCDEISVAASQEPAASPPIPRPFSSHWQVVATWAEYDMAGLLHAAEFETLALTAHTAAAPSSSYSGSRSSALALRSLASAGLSGRVGLNLWQADAAVEPR